MSPETVKNNECLISGQQYMSYLWLGHCVMKPEDYREAAVAFHQDERFADDITMNFIESANTDPERILIEQLGRVVVSAQRELGKRTPLDASARRQLQVYLAGDVSTRGQEFALQNKLFDDFPDLNTVTTPLANSHLVDGLIRYKKTGKLSKALRNQATFDRLLPGYQLTAEDSAELTLGTLPERLATVSVLQDVIRRRSN